MSSVSRCMFSTTPSLSTSAAEACASLISRFGNKPISVRKQLLDANQVQQLTLAIGRTNIHRGIPVVNDPPPNDTPLPPGYHLVYFTPALLEQDLGPDGTDRTVNPPAPFTRRMWAGGELKWSQEPSKYLRVGQIVKETTRMLGVEPKRSKNGTDILVVSVEKIFENDQGIALIDQRNWVFRTAITQAQTPQPRPEEKCLPEAEHMRDFTQTDVSLFRFSALTYNGHKIHYSPEWCQKVEGHRHSVVHGPLNLINILDHWRDVAKHANEDAIPKSINYRMMSPLYAGERYRILLRRDASEKDEEWTANIWDSFGKQSVKAIVQN
jgi:hydroxyacyl-ACP dehydratase HTD2-like protein with hotdog domain